MDSKINQILVDGPNPLTSNFAESFINTIERCLVLHLTDEQQAIFENQLVIEWKKSKSNQQDIKKTLKEFKDVQLQIETLPFEKQVAAWGEVGRQLYIHAQKKGKSDPVGQLIISAYESKNNLLVTGNPPLSHLAAESYIEMQVFIQSLIKGQQLFVTKDEKAKLVIELTNYFKSADKGTQTHLSQSDMLWSILRFNWRAASKVEKTALRQQLLESVSKPVEQTKELIPNQGKSGDDKPNMEKATSENSNESMGTSPTLDIKNSKFLSVINKLREKATKTLPFNIKK